MLGFLKSALNQMKVLSEFEKTMNEAENWIPFSQLRFPVPL
jgi:hypothetical protein